MFRLATKEEMAVLDAKWKAGRRRMLREDREKEARFAKQKAEDIASGKWVFLKPTDVLEEGPDGELESLSAGI